MDFAVDGSINFIKFLDSVTWNTLMKQNSS